MNSSVPKKKPVRERFSGPIVVAGIVAGFLALLVLLYPEQSLRHLLEREGERTPAGRVYLEALLQSRPGDHQVRLTLAQTVLSAGCYRNVLKILDGFSGNLPIEIQQDAERLRYTALRELLKEGEGDPSTQAAFESLARRKIQNQQNDQELAGIEFDATSLGLSELAEAVKKRRSILHPDDTVPDIPTVDQYRHQAEAVFASLANAPTINERRALFLKGVKILQSGNLAIEALHEGERYLAPLANDRETLMVMTRVALAAGKPAKAQIFVRRALGMGRTL